ncbi:MAG: hypothetical protein ABR543_14355 [Gemmatimonadaceae bacterium]
MRVWVVGVIAVFFLSGCSPEASRVRDGGPGADVGNKTVVQSAASNPTAADTTLWPGKAPAPVERHARQDTGSRQPQP